VTETILVVDDEPRIAEIVRAYLEREGFRVLTAADGVTALSLARHSHPDLVILDLMLPELSGFEVCRALQSEGGPPIIMLTARDEAEDRIAGLELGADDYVTKPFNPRELAARVKAVLRRGRVAPPATRMLLVGDLAIDPERHVVQLAGRSVPLTPTEFAILEALASQPGRAFSRLQLLERSQGEAYEGYERVIDSHVKNLRQKLEVDPRHPRHVLTVFGIGYKMAEPDMESRTAESGESR
jgi:DNA-binding response OmpR family regulator